MNAKLKNSIPLLLALFAGALAPFSLSPINLWPLGILSTLGLFALLSNTNTKQALQRGWAFGFAYYGVGVSWIFVSLNTYGNVNTPTSVFLVTLFVAGLALLFAGQAWCFQRVSKNQPNSIILFAVMWLLFEWLRTWLFTGFPWLFLGYAHIHSPLAGLAPIVGVMGLGFIVSLSGAGLYKIALELKAKRKPIMMISTLIGIWLLCGALTTVDWVTEKTEQSITVGLVQASIAQEDKFDRSLIQQGLDSHTELSWPYWEDDYDLIVWPETAIPLPLQEVDYLLDAFGQVAQESNSTLISGIFFEEDNKIYNSIISLGNGEGIHHKQRMVPFGEYVPFGDLFGGLLRFFSLPHSTVKPGPKNISLLSAGEIIIAPYICYEVVYPDYVRRHAVDADLLLSISNDTWFGESFHSPQHVQMAAMRSLENGRYMVRAASSGISAIIDERGNILKQSEQFITEVLTGEAKIFEGRTPFSKWGSYPVVLLSFIYLLVLFRKQVLKQFQKQFQKKHQQTKNP